MMTDDVCGIYLITNTINGHMYVGQSIGIHKRWREHCALKDSHSSLVEKAIAKYGVENFSFEIIITLENDTDKLNDAEREWIAILNTYEDKNHYNQTPGGDFSPMKVPDIVAKISGENNPMKNPEARAKISGENNPFYGCKHTPEAKEKISTANSGKKLSEDTRKKMSEARNTIGYYRVTKEKSSKYRQGFRYLYRYCDDDGKRHAISSVDIKKLEKKVKAKGLLWFRIGGDE